MPEPGASQPAGAPARPRVVLVAALDFAGVIGVDKKLPWHLPRDLKHFRAITLEKPVIMGRKTFESIGKPLARRPNIVLTRAGSAWQAPAGVELARSLDEALALAARHAAAEAMVIGGAGVFADAVPRADRLELTVVEARVRGDTVFPAVHRDAWRVAAFERVEADEANAYACDFVTLARVPDVPATAGAPVDWAELVAAQRAAAS